MKSQVSDAETALAFPAIEPSSRVAGSQGRPYLNGHVVIFALATVLALATASECHSITYVPSLIYGATLWGWWGCIASIVWKLGERVPLLSSLSARAVAMHVLTGAALGVGHLLLLGSLGFTVPEWRSSAPALQVWTSAFNINRFGVELLIYGFVFGISGVIQYQMRAQRAAIQALELQRQLSAAHLRALQMQLEPHFLFNTLNAITTLVELGRQKPAAEMLYRLNAILKSTLGMTTPGKVPLSQELEYVGNYLAIEQVRFADRLRIAIDVDPNAVDGLVPCFLLQPIVENAIRHGIAHCENNGLVEASAVRDGNQLHVWVRDTGAGPKATQLPGHGIGLKNTRDRLDHFYHDGYKMRAGPLNNGGFEVAITIPYECQEA
jgi:signal transduction histidine kinase